MTKCIGYTFKQGSFEGITFDNILLYIVSDDDHEDLAEGIIPESLWEAVRYFIVGSAIKCKRATKTKEHYSDMIIHAFREVSQHSSIYTSICNYISSMKDSFEYDDEDKKIYLSEFRKCYEIYVSADIRASITFDSLVEEIETVVKKTKVILKNGIGKTTQGNEKLKWHKIYIGGDLLQRGLTFSNLITTYFTRWATGGGNMDTNLQRARWFGYRSKYINICKIFTRGKCFFIDQKKIVVFFDCNTFQLIAAKECLGANYLYGRRDENTFYTAAIIKCL